MDEMDLINILDELPDGEFKNLKWFLKKESWKGTPAIKPSLLQNAERQDIVDLLVQNFELDGAGGVIQSALKKICRNDLVSQIKAFAIEQEDNASKAGTPEAQLLSIRSEFVDRVSDPVLRKLMDKLLDQRVITDNEVESAGTIRAEKARYVIDMVRKKGSRASSALITALNEVDSCLAEQLNLN